MTRRDVLTTLLSAAALGHAVTGTAAASTAGEHASLDSLARRKGVRFGTAVGGRSMGAAQPNGFDHPAYRSLVARECSVVVHENELKWQALRPRAEVFAYGPADALASWARDRHLALRGHTLLWHAPQWLPDWVTRHDFGARPVQEAERLLTEHIRNVCQRYGQQIGSWDVVNESVTPEDGELRDNVFAPHLGKQGQVELAFRLAREQMPKAELVYNDFMSWGNHSAKHRAGVLKLLTALRTRDVPVQALGLQSHLGSGSNGQWVSLGGNEEREWRKFLDEVSALGLDLLITELDVNDRYLAADPAKRDAEVAAVARGYLDVTLSYRNLRTVMAWGMADPVSWMLTWWPRADGIAKRPTLYDGQLRPKLFRAAIAEAFQAMPERPAS